MARVLVLFAALALCVTGCTAKYDEKMTLLETKIDDHESRLNNLESRSDLMAQDVQGLKDENKKLLDEKKAILLKSGTNNLTNQEIQAALKSAGFYKGAVDGKMGPETQAAVKEFQKANNLKVDGVIGKETKALLMKHLPEESY